MPFSSCNAALAYRDNYEYRVARSVAYLKEKMGDRHPAFGIVLGSGLGDLADSINEAVTIPYADIPEFPTTTVEGHEGKMIIGTLEGVPVVGLKGRKHYYESADDPCNTGILQVVFPVHVLASLGTKNYFVTNAAGGLNPKYNVGDVMIIRSHINLLPNPLLGRHHTFTRVDNNKRVERFQPMNDVYNRELRQMLIETGAAQKGHVHEGVYLAVPGPTYETQGECIAFRDGLKADAVGMSTTPEVIVARNR